MADEKRLLVIKLSILIERFVSEVLSKLLDIDLKNSKTLGNKSSAFSFSQKLNLLLDIRATDNSAVKKFTTFSEIRNQFAHNADVCDFQSCFSFLDGKEKELKKIYNNINGLEKFSPEDQLECLYIHLFYDILNISNKILESVVAKIMNISKEQSSREVLEQIISSIKASAMTDTDFNEKYNKIIDEVRSKFSTSDDELNSPQ